MALGSIENKQTNRHKVRKRIQQKGIQSHDVNRTGQLRPEFSTSMLLRTVSKEALPKSRKLSSGGGGGSSRSGSSLISRKEGLRVIAGLDGTEGGEGGSCIRRAAFFRMGGGDNGLRTTLFRSPTLSKGTPSARGVLAPEDVDGRIRGRGGTGSPDQALRDWKDRERAPSAGEGEWTFVESPAFACREFPRVLGRSSLPLVA